MTLMRKFSDLLISVMLMASAAFLSSCAQVLVPLVADPLALGGPVKPGPDYVWHGFEHSNSYDSPSIAILNYEYGQIKPLPSDYEAPGIIKPQRRNYKNSVFGLIKRGEFLYVKWLSLTDQKIFEARVDLRERLPKNIEGHRINYTIKNNLLFIWLITPESRTKNEPTNRPLRYLDFSARQIHPIVN